MTDDENSLDELRQRIELTLAACNRCVVPLGGSLEEAAKALISDDPSVSVEVVLDCEAEGPRWVLVRS